MKKIILLLLAILCLGSVNAEYDVYSTVFYAAHNATSNKFVQIFSLFVNDEFDDLLSSSTSGPGGYINGLFDYTVNDLNQSQFQNIAFVTLNCTLYDAQFDVSGATMPTVTSTLVAAQYDTTNTPVSLQDIPFSVDSDDLVQCRFQIIYKTNTNNSLNPPYSSQFIVPTLGSNFVSKLASYAENQAAELAISQYQHNIDVLQAYNDSIASYLSFIVKGIYELYLVLFFLIKIALIYIAFILVILAIVFPVFLLIRFRKKVREWLNLDKTY